jgi:hypothetical protein
MFILALIIRFFILGIEFLIVFGIIYILIIIFNTKRKEDKIDKVIKEIKVRRTN